MVDKSLDHKNDSNRIRSSSLESLKDKNLVSKSIFKKNSKKSNKNTDSTVPLKKVLGDNKWIEKQILGFTEWLNYNFNKNHHSNFKEADEDDIDETKEDVTDIRAMKQLAQKRAEAQVRKIAYEKLHELKNSLASVHHEITQGHMELRDDRDLLADIGLQETFLGLLFSYETPWLRLGLEVVFGEILSLPNRYRGTEATQWIKTIKAFIMERFLSDPEILATKKKYTYHGTEDVTKTELRKHILKKFTSLVLFLDTARNSQMLTLPTLFKKTSEHKSTKDYLSYFCKEFLKGEGDLVRHLSTMQYNVSFVQTYIDEFDYTVTNLAIDLRDGVRLARLIELLTNQFDKSSLLRVPAVSRLQKLHNVGITVKYVKDTGIDESANTKTIVDGDRDKTLVLLWRIMYHFDLQKLINADVIENEVKAIRQNEEWRRSEYLGDDVDQLAVSVNKDPSNISKCPSNESTLSIESKDPKSDALIKNLINWCSAITEQYEVPVYNLTSCLADGRALCLLIHYYHPTLLPLNHIKKTTSNFDHLPKAMTSLDHFTETNITVKRSELVQAIANEHRNFATLKKACTDIGGVPSMLPFYDSKNIPEEKTMVVFLGHLFARLVETSAIIQASIRIQRYVRNVYLVKIGKAIATKRALAHAKRAMKRAAFVEKTKDNKFVTEVPIHVTMSDEAADNQAAIVIARRVIAFMTRCRFLRYIADRKIDKDLKEVKANAFVVRKANYGIPNKSFSTFPLSNTERAERDRVITCPYTPSTPGDEFDETFQFSDRSDRRQSDQYSQVSDRTDLSNEFILDDKAAMAMEAAKSMAIKEAEALTQSRMRQIEEEKALLVRQMKEEAERKAAILLEEQEKKTASLLEEQEKKLCEQLLFSEAQLAEKERSVKMDIELASLKAEGMIEAAVEEAQIKAREAQEEAQRLVELEKQNALAAQEKALREKEAREEMENKMRELEENASFEERMALQAKEAAEDLLESERIARLELEEQLQNERQAAEEMVRFNEEVKHTNEMKIREEAEVKMREIEQNQLAEKEARLALEQQLKEMQEKQLASDIERARLLEEKERAEEEARISKAKIEEEERKREEAEKMKRFEEEQIKLQKERELMAELAEKQRQAELEIARGEAEAKQKAEAEAQRLAMEEEERLKLLEEERLAQEAAKAEEEALLAQKQLQEQEKLQRLSSAAVRIARFFRAFKAFFRARKLISGFKRLQAVYKANIVRANRGPKLNKIYQKLAIANANSKANPSLRLSNQTAEALSVLQNGRMISQLFKACQLLELATRVSKKCSHTFATAGAASILFSLIQSCNRSAPHQEILRYSLVILLHVARHDELAPIVANAEHSTEVVIHLMQMFRDKGQIFCLSCELLCRLVVASSKTKDECNSATSRKCLEGILHIIETKHRLQSRVSAVVAKTKTFVDNACISPKGKARYLASEEPVNCVRHLMKLLSEEEEQ